MTARQIPSLGGGGAGPAGPAGPAGLQWQGEWSSLSAYIQNDAVTYLGSTYRSKSDQAAGGAAPGEAVAYGTNGPVALQYNANAVGARVPAGTFEGYGNDLVLINGVQVATVTNNSSRGDLWFIEAPAGTVVSVVVAQEAGYRKQIAAWWGSDLLHKGSPNAGSANLTVPAGNTGIFVEIEGAIASSGAQMEAGKTYTVTFSGSGIVSPPGGPKWELLAAKGDAGPAATIASDTIWDAQGDLVVGSGADAAIRKAVGSDKDILVADTAAAGGIKWVAGGGWGAWTDVTFAGVWGNFGAPYQNVQYRLNSITSEVQVRGLARANNGAWAPTMFTLPAGHRPLANQYFACAHYAATANRECVVLVQIDTAGVVTTHANLGPSASGTDGSQASNTKLDGIYFSIL